MDRDEIADELRRRLSGGRSRKILQFLLNAASSTPVLGGIFSAAAAAWSGRDQGAINRLVEQLLQIRDDEVVEIRNTLVRVSDQSHVVAGYITFNPNSFEIFETSGVSSLSDTGTLDFAVTFIRPLRPYVFAFYGTGPVVVESVRQTDSGIHVTLKDPAPDRVTLVFFEPDRPSGPSK